LKVNAQAYAFEASNVRHAHEWRLWEELKLPAGKILAPGVVGVSPEVPCGTSGTSSGGTSGSGSVGSAIAVRLAPFEVDLRVVARTARDGVHGTDELKDLLPTADVVILAIPYGPVTHHLVDEAFLAALPDGALVVNVARGSVVDTDALLAELTTGRLRAALDVTDPEPLPPDHPLWSAPNVVITPHVGGDTSAFLPRAWLLLQQQLDRFAARESLAHVVRSG
jgi:phosphoglycerate dehydrogenase-like enzyme